MAVLKSMVLWVAFFLSCSSSGEAFHSDSQHVDAFENILKTMKLNNSLELQTLTTLLKNLGLQDCSDNTAHLHQVKLFDIFNMVLADAQIFNVYCLSWSVLFISLSTFIGKDFNIIDEHLIHYLWILEILRPTPWIFSMELCNSTRRQRF